MKKKILLVSCVFYLLSYLPFSLSGEYRWCNFGGQVWRNIRIYPEI